MIFFELNSSIGKLFTKLKKPKNTIINFLRTQDVLYIYIYYIKHCQRKITKKNFLNLLFNLK